MEEQFLILFAVVAGAAAIPFFSRRIGIPSAVLEILYGVALFHTVIIHHPQWFSLFKELGFIYLMFIAGMELDIRQLKEGGRLCWYLLISALPFAVMPALFARMGYPFYLGVAVSVLSAGIVIPVLKESGRLYTDWGRDAVGIALTGEFLSIFALTVLDVYQTHGLTLMALFAAAKLLLLLLLSGLLLRLLYILAWWNPERVERVMESEDPVEEGIRAVVAVAFAGALIAAAAGVEAILGSFMAGLIFSFVFRTKGRFEEKINAVGFGFFTPFFFIGIGADFPVDLLTSTKALFFAVVLTGALFTSRFGVLLFGRVLGFSPLETAGTALILGAPLSLLVVASALGKRMGLLSSDMAGSVVIAAILSGILYPFLFRHLTRWFPPASRASGPGSHGRRPAT
jgi:Kef-type K+ transport system membrane component KefB